MTKKKKSSEAVSLPTGYRQRYAFRWKSVASLPHPHPLSLSLSSAVSSSIFTFVSWSFPKRILLFVFFFFFCGFFFSQRTSNSPQDQPVHPRTLHHVERRAAQARHARVHLERKRSHHHSRLLPNDALQRQPHHLQTNRGHHQVHGDGENGRRQRTFALDVDWDTQLQSW